MYREHIINAIREKLRSTYTATEADRIIACMTGILAELDALPPYPSESEFQALLSDQVYPIMALHQAVEDDDWSAKPPISVN